MAENEVSKVIGDIKENVLKKALNTGFVIFFYTKSDGMKRKAIGTRNVSTVQAISSWRPTGAKENTSSLCYFDLEKLAWRSMRFGSLIDIAVADFSKAWIDPERYVVSQAFAARDAINEAIANGEAGNVPRLVDIFTKMGVEFCFGYGLTETANLTSANADAVTHPTSIGKIYPGQETRVVDGELWIKGDNVFSGYYKDPARTAEAFTEDGWFRTGDLVRFDDEGFLYITGRIKNLIILANGENVSPESLEEPFYADPYVRDAMVKEDELNGHKVIAVEILPFMPAFDGKTMDDIRAYMNSLVDKVNAGLPSTHRIMKVTVRTEDFKRTGSMKVARV